MPSPPSHHKLAYHWRGEDPTSHLSHEAKALNQTIGCKYFRRKSEEEISRLRRELDVAKAVIEEKDRLLAGQARDIDEGKQQLGEKERSLKEAQSNNRTLNAQLGQRNQELRRHEEEMQQHKREHALTVDLLETRTQELKGAEAFLTKADALSDADVIALVNALNSEMYQMAAMVAEAFDYKARVEEVESSVEEVDGLTEVHASVIDAIGAKMVEMLKSSDHREDPTIIQIAFQAAMAAYSNWIVRSWNLEEQEADIGFNKVYKEIRNAEEQAISGRWRALTRKYLPNTDEHELSYLFIDAIINILLVANAVLSHDELLKTIETRFAERIAIIVRGAQKLRKAIGEEVTSCDLEVIFINHDSDTPFSRTQMDDAFAGNFENGKDEPEPVLCTMELGLQKFERRPGKEVIWEDTILLRPKIALRSGIEEMVGSAGNLP
ncbi:hypothetical protein C0995_008317 [Termitomyces sp. Mi166|nr:hypothetical protein C0995_008317 [Termitomyces sp. Mi166\